jgi:prophage tail gpP-like protein
MPDVKPYPTPGFLYKIQPGDTMTKIGLRAGIPWQQIWTANPSIIQISNNPDLIYPAQTIFIPGGAPQPPATNPAANAGPDSYKFILDGLEVPVSAFRLQRSLDSIFDSWTAEIAWLPGDNKDLDKRTAAYAYPAASLYLGRYLVASGRLYDVTPKVSDAGISKTLECFTATVDLVDSKMPPDYAMEWQGATLGTIAKDILQKLGYQYKLNYDPKAPYDFAQLEKFQSPAAFLIKLAAERSILVTNDETGAVVLMQPNVNAKPVGTLEQADISAGAKSQGATEWSIKFAGRERFHNYIVIGQGGDATDTISKATDSNVPAIRTMAYESDYLDPNNTKDTAAWRRSLQVAKSMTFPVPVVGWYCPTGEPWAPGMLVTIKSSVLNIPNGYVFCIRNTGHVLDERGRTCILGVCPPAALTGGIVDEPWASAGGKA